MFTAGGCLTWCSATRTRCGCTGCLCSSLSRLWAARTEPSRAGEAGRPSEGWLGGRPAGHQLAAGVLVQAVEQPVGDGEGFVVGAAGQGEAADQDVEARCGWCVVVFVGQVGFMNDVADP